MSRVGFISLGCPKALVDSERILTQLRLDGYEVVGDYAEADLVVVNTCGFIDEAKAESLEAIGEALDENGRVVVTGCMGAKPEDILSIHPKVLSVTGPHQYQEVVSAVHQHAPEVREAHDPFTSLVPDHGVKLTPKHYAYMKISEGCNHRCSFCIIPSMRGDLVSRPIDEVLGEAKRLAMAGVQELLVISQDTSAYGVDLKYAEREWQGAKRRTHMLDLCDALGDLGLWVRLHYVYPYPHVDKVIPLMTEGRVLPYLDIPFQHASPKILKQMRRPAASEKVLGRIHEWRRQCPELAIRSTFIVGFPGETDEDFEQLLEFLEQAQLDRVGCFKYSPVDGANANALPDAVEESVKEQRWNQFMAVQSEISAQRLKAKIGQRIEVMVDGVGEEGAWVGRSWADAPEIDGVVVLSTEQLLYPGQRVMAQVEAASEHDLMASICRD